MSEMNKMNPEQMEEVAGGAYQGRLTKTEMAAVEFSIKLLKYKGRPMETYLEIIRNSKDWDIEKKEAVEKYARTFWDRLESF